ncbi:hypothetical protein [Arthrobacter caoxuetaonis]|uniref:Uncharacterized protein n=1 Tax=Arthrobacter caoxuetaonis TaxID=2886935 RepID=A0A9X1MG16_9MICC|nr:hypothetical protein [Arthrobacter caoxuetaonis]MCC3299424.1 hypothetical protein [Arthrobacter caoxuetaonis]USQ59083.1 hypothetical protein NF551_18430 [Arthrobacter caoxuetaonis]
MTSPQIPSAGTAPKTHTAAILSIEPAPNGRSLVSFRTAMTNANPSGRGTAYTPLISAVEGRAISSTLRARINHGPVRQRNTVLDIVLETGEDGEQLQVIREVR